MKRGEADEFVLYVEGARDREILSTWARRLEPPLSRTIERSTVILGGRQPARAVTDFRKRGGHPAGIRGLIVLDRDHHEEELDGNGRVGPGNEIDEQGMEVFVWGLRHIESYLLVPAAIRRVLGHDEGDDRVARALEDRRLGELDGNPAAGRRGGVHAKRILGAGGSLSEILGAELRAGVIARAMRPDDLHADVQALFERIRALSGFDDRGPEVVIRSPRG